ncbi:hypothetical protein [Paenibacillus pabuli]|uniref:hypothetical protein n=1 Tax=Paenibacillus pabuli TaxID=1472 RepID=UPI0020003657|nr:hypothetical protein [Paenibacillus pabuli]UPK45931.1 hypothetical protein KET34_10965 [Paenibacillus pabuli]
MSKLIQNDDQLKKAIEGMERLTLKIEEPDPLDDAGLEKDIAILNRTADLVQKYSRGKVVQADPSRAAYYDQMGWSYQDFSAPVEAPQTAPKTNTTTETKQVPKQPTELPKTASKVSSWLDD